MFPSFLSYLPFSLLSFLLPSFIFSYPFLEKRVDAEWPVRGLCGVKRTSNFGVDTA